MGRCRILTDTPEKNQLEEEESIKKRKVSCKKITVKKILASSSSEEENELQSSSDSLEDVEWGQKESDDDDFAKDETKVDDFVLTKLQGKKSHKYFIAKVTEVISNERVSVQYFKRISGEKFILEDKTVYEILMSEIIKTLPQPLITGGTERRTHQLHFPVDFSSYNLE